LRYYASKIELAEMKPVLNFSGMHIEVLEIAVVKLVAILRDEKASRSKIIRIMRERKKSDYDRTKILRKI